MDKKKILILTVACSIAIISAFNVSIKTSERGLSNVSLDNIEALAQETNIPTCVPVRGHCTRNGISSDQIALN